METITPEEFLLDSMNVQATIPNVGCALGIGPALPKIG